jgi:hypothetical protein
VLELGEVLPLDETVLGEQIAQSLIDVGVGNARDGLVYQVETSSNS